ncbi:hypothetical protein [Methanosarcina mazei]|jgi:hypothetical protein|uniref:Uncharacterized protein n=1 Tax=Methanosarcina mazei TaxID=2209 RepID=A0A0F8SHQ2_METMZ|nr:hypothetical protein [Methanosarcina mazei]KKH66266.1 hypothetical protein DU75_03550 [Methanosarcina mazei]
MKIERLIEDNDLRQLWNCINRSKKVIKQKAEKGEISKRTEMKALKELGKVKNRLKHVSNLS